MNRSSGIPTRLRAAVPLLAGLLLSFASSQSAMAESLADAACVQSAGSFDMMDGVVSPATEAQEGCDGDALPMLSRPLASPSSLTGLPLDGLSDTDATKLIDSVVGTVLPLARHGMEGVLDGVLVPPGGMQPVALTPKVLPAPGDITRMVETWAQAWSARDTQAYLAHYSAEFSTGEADFSFAQWSQQRRQRVLKPAWITVKATDIRVVLTGPDGAQVRFVQDYRSPNHAERTRKVMTLQRQGTAWRILSERAEQ